MPIRRGFGSLPQADSGFQKGPFTEHRAKSAVLLFLRTSALTCLTLADERNVRDRRHLGFPAVTGETDHAETSSHQGCG
jgi:hypothetical protein